MSRRTKNDDPSYVAICPVCGSNHLHSIGFARDLTKKTDHLCWYAKCQDCNAPYLSFDTVDIDTELGLSQEVN